MNISSWQSHQRNAYIKYAYDRTTWCLFWFHMNWAVLGCFFLFYFLSVQKTVIIRKLLMTGLELQMPAAESNHSANRAAAIVSLYFLATFLFYFSSAQKNVIIRKLLMTGFEQQTPATGSNHSANRAAVNASLCLFLSRFILFIVIVSFAFSSFYIWKSRLVLFGTQNW